MTDRPIAAIRKNAREEIRVSIRDFKGRRAIDIRVYEERGQGLTPSPKGLAVRPDLIKELIEGLRQAETAAVAEGLVDPGEQ